MKLATLGIIATALFASAIGPVANAGSLLVGNVERKLERTETRDYRQHRGEGRQRERHSNRNYRRHDDSRNHGHRHAQSDHRYGRGHGPRANWRWYKPHRHHQGYRRHGHRYGHGKIVFRHHIHGNPLPAIAGGIIGGAIAHEASGGDQGATAVGAVLGAVIASEATRHRHHR